MTGVLYVPGTEETDPKKIIMSQQLVAAQTSANAASITDNTTSIANINASRASSSGFGLAKVDGTTLTAAAGVISQSLSNATLQTSPANPTGTTGNLMMGLGGTCKLTPVYSSRVYLVFRGNYQNASAGVGTDISVRWGTGTAPANGAASTGTALGTIKHMNNSTAGGAVPFDIGGIITGLTPGTAIWFDILLNGNGTSATATNLDCSAMEF